MSTPKKRKGERPDGYIQVSTTVTDYATGKRVRKYFYGKTRKEATQKRDDFIRQQKALTETGLPQNITVKEWTEIFKQTYLNRVNPAYMSSTLVPYNRLVDAIGHMPVAHVREADLQQILNSHQGKSYSTVDKYRQAMKRLFEKARKNKIIHDNPADDLHLPPCKKGSHRALETWEVELILNNWDNDATVAGLWVLLCLLCGLRRGEMMALQWDNINMDKRTLTVTQVAVIRSNQPIIEKRAKTQAGLRTIPVCKALYDALLTVPEHQRTGFVCKSKNGQPLTETSVRRGLKTFCNVLERLLNNEPLIQSGRRTDLENNTTNNQNQLVRYNRTPFSFTWHDLRHTYATALYDAGVPVKAAQYFLGHSDVRITLDLYTHLSTEKEVTSRNKMVAYLDDWVDQRMKSDTPYLTS